MTEQEVYDKLTTVFRRIFEDDTLVAKPEMKASDVERWDSLSHIDMILATEEMFGIHFSTREVTRLQNVGDLVRAILDKVE